MITVDKCETRVTSYLSSLAITWTLLFFQCTVWLWSARSCAWSLPWVSLDSSAQGVGCRQCLGDARDLPSVQCCSFDSPGLNHVLLQSILRSISLHQPGTSELGGDFCFLWEWVSSHEGSVLSVGKIVNVKSQVLEGKYSKD